MAVKLGEKVKDSISGFEGIATEVAIWINGCVHVHVEPEGLKDGKPIEGLFFDEYRVTNEPRKVNVADYPLLGKKVKDSVTGFQGTVTARSESMGGSVRYQVEPTYVSEKESKARWFDEARINPESKVESGGPGPIPSMRDPK